MRPIHLHIRVYDFLLGYTRSRPIGGIESLHCAVLIFPTLVTLAPSIISTYRIFYLRGTPRGTLLRLSQLFIVCYLRAIRRLELNGTIKRNAQVVTIQPRY